MYSLSELLTLINETSPEEFQAWPLEALDDVIQQLGVMKSQIRQCDSALQIVLHNRFHEKAQRLRLFAGKTTGTVRLEAEGYVVIADLPKRPEYDQNQLKLAVETLRRWGENPDDYVTTDIKVSEAKYNAWPPGIRELFEPARTLKTGKATYTLVAPTQNLSEVA